MNSGDATGGQLKPMLKTDEVAGLFKVDPETVRVWARAGKIPARKNPGGRTFMYRRVEIEALMAEDGSLTVEHGESA